jgi:hypothetical protein
MFDDDKHASLLRQWQKFLLFSPPKWSLHEWIIKMRVETQFKTELLKILFIFTDMEKMGN